MELASPHRKGAPDPAMAGRLAESPAPTWAGHEHGSIGSGSGSTGRGRDDIAAHELAAAPGIRIGDPDASGPLQRTILRHPDLVRGGVSIRRMADVVPGRGGEPTGLVGEG